MALRLCDGIAEVVVRPELGGGLAAYNLVAGGERQALFRPVAGPEPADTLALACSPLVPWSNRISGGGFRFDGRFHALEANWPGEPCPLHGNGWQSPWSVSGRERHAVTLALASDGPGPFCYAATLDYWLEDGALGMRLTVEHRGAAPLPYGLGFHPWLVRSAATTLQASATGVWLEDAWHLPVRCVPIRDRPEWDFSQPRALPTAWINNGFVGWDGRAVVVWPDRRLALALDARQVDGAPSALGVYIVYSPHGQAPFFCFEPVSHPVNAHNLAGAPGLIALAPGESAAAQCRFIPRAV